MQMERNFGFIHDKLEIKILILFIMRRVPEPVTFDALTGLTLCDDGISYFAFSECVAELVQTEHLRFEGDKYSLTKKGERNGKVTENSLPFSVRMSAEEGAVAFRALQDRNAMIKTSHASNPDGGCSVTLSLSDGVGKIASMELFAADEKQALALEKGFRKNAESIYKALIEMILN